MLQTLNCPSVDRWQELLAEPSSSDSGELEAHLAGCTRCQSVLDDLAVGSSGWLRDAGRLASKTDNDPEMTKTLHRLREALADHEHAVPEISLHFLTPSDQPGVLGTLGRYQVLEVIGRGAFGIVLKALDPDLLRPVAIKVLAPYLAPNGTARQRFLREARAAAAVIHDNVINVHAVEIAGDVPYIVMEFVTGISLQGRLDRDGPLPPRDIARIGHQAASGLAAAHEQGLVHRDIKPANILLENGVERVKITDFGLARAANDAALTQSGVAAGTPLYMSPEQTQGDKVDHRSDLFSLGSVLYTLGTGFPPFRADSTMGVLNRISNQPPRPIRETIPDFPPDLEKIIMQLLEKDPEKRFQLAADVSFKLTGFLSGPETTPASDGVVIKSRIWTTVLCVLAAIAVVAVVLLFKTPRGGTLIVEVDDPEIKVALDGEELTITGAGPQEVRLKPGTYRVTASKDGKPAKVSQEIVTITKNGKQIVKVTIVPESPPNEREAAADALLTERIKNALPDADLERLGLMLYAWKEAQSGELIARHATNPPVPQTHPEYARLKVLMLGASKSDIAPDQLKKVLNDAYTLAGKILQDTATSASLMSGKKTTDPAWGAKLEDLRKKFDDLANRLKSTSAATVFGLPGPITDYDKAVTAVPEKDREYVKRLLGLRDLFALELPRAQSFASRLEDAKKLVASSLRKSLEDSLSDHYATLTAQLREMDKLAVALGAKPAPKTSSPDPLRPSDNWEESQKKVVKEFNALIAAIAKTRTGQVLTTAGPNADPDKATAGMMSRDANRAKKLLSIRDRFEAMVPRAQKELERWEKARVEFKNIDANYKAGAVPSREWEQAKLELSQAARALVATDEAMAQLLGELNQMAKESGVVGKAAAEDIVAEFKKVMAEYDALVLRLAKTSVGRLLATIPVDKGWGDAELQNTFGSDKAKIEQGRKLLTYRDQIDKQSRQAETAVVERSSRLKSKETTNVEDTHPEINELIRKNEQDVRFRTAAIRGIVDDLKTLADEIDPPAKEGPGQ